MAAGRHTKAHGLRREDFPTVYHFRAAIQRTRIPFVWSPQGWREVDPAFGGTETLTNVAT